MTLKQVWLTRHDAGFAVLSLESADPHTDYRRVRVSSSAFPVTPSPAHPLRHVAIVELLDRDDLTMIRDAIDAHLRAA